VRERLPGIIEAQIFPEMQRPDDVLDLCPFLGMSMEEDRPLVSVTCAPAKVRLSTWACPKKSFCQFTVTFAEDFLLGAIMKISYGVCEKMKQGADGKP
jgi:hypothetical protein